MVVFTAREGSLDAVRWLLENAGVDWRRRNNRHRSALDWAKANGKDETASLIEKHATEHANAEFM